MQLRIACDSAAKAALINFGATNNQTTALAVANSVAAHNLVAGQKVSFTTSTLQFGNSTKNGSGVYVFALAGTPLNSVQVTGTVNPGLPMTSYMPVSTFTTQQVSVATRVSHDIMLVLDRSASMAFDQTSNEFEYPTAEATNATPMQCYFLPPDPTSSRWAALCTAVNSFITTLQARNLNVRVGLVTYAETYSFGSYSATEASLDVPLTSNLTLITNAMNNWGTQPLLGDTNISAGLAMASGELTGSDGRTCADRTIILLTDGVATQGNLNIPSVVQGLAPELADHDRHYHLWRRGQPRQRRIYEHARCRDQRQRRLYCVPSAAKCSKPLLISPTAYRPC